MNVNATAGSVMGCFGLIVMRDLFT